MGIREGKLVAGGARPSVAQAGSQVRQLDYYLKREAAVSTVETITGPHRIRTLHTSVAPKCNAPVRRFCKSLVRRLVILREVRKFTITWRDHACEVGKIHQAIQNINGAGISAEPGKRTTMDYALIWQEATES